MITYNVKKSRKSRLTYRIFGFFLMAFALCQLTIVIMGYGREHIIGNIICVFLLIYGLYLVLHTFRKQAYDICYEFGEEAFTVTHYRGKDTYTYDMVDDVSVIIPENELIYSLIHLTVGKESYLIPFSYKKDACDKIYKFINERVTARKTEQEILKDTKNE